MHPSGFEQWVANRFVNAGYSANVTGGAGDDGIDIIVRHGNQIRYVVQCKRFGSNTVVTPEQVRDFRGAMTAHPEAAGYIVTTGSLSAQAATWVQKQPITIIDWRIIERWKPEPPA